MNYDLSVKYSNKSFAQYYVDYFRSTFFNSMPFEFKMKILGKEIVNIKCFVYKYLFLH